MKEEKLVTLLKELLRNSRRSDRELARAIDASQPTVTRNRRILDKYIRSYTVTPDFGRIGYEIMAITFAKAKSYGKEENEAKLKLARKWIESHPNIVFSSDGEGLAKDVVFVSFHENYSKYAGFVREFSGSLADFFNDVQSFVVSLKTGVILKPFDLATLANDISQLQIEEDHP